MTQGMVAVGDLVATFTILTSDGQSSVVADAVAMMGSAAHMQ